MTVQYVQCSACAFVYPSYCYTPTNFAFLRPCTLIWRLISRVFKHLSLSPNRSPPFSQSPHPHHLLFSRYLSISLSNMAEQDVVSLGQNLASLSLGRRGRSSSQEVEPNPLIIWTPPGKSLGHKSLRPPQFTQDNPSIQVQT
jgi:hypothetical protein